MPYAPPHPAPPLSEPARTADEQAPGRSVSLSLVACAALASLGAVVCGFVLVALALVGVGGVSLPWGAGLCVGGWALAAALREGAGGERVGE